MLCHTFFGSACSAIPSIQFGTVDEFWVENIFKWAMTANFTAIHNEEEVPPVYIIIQYTYIHGFSPAEW